MSRLLLLRHAKSSWDAGPLPDVERPLSERGRSAAAAMARTIAERDLLPDRVLCSPARRTRETLAALLPFLKDEGRIAMVDDLYAPAAADYRAVIAENAGEAATLMVIGHNPTIQATAVALAGSGAPGLRGEIAARYPTGALAVIDFATDDWTAIAPGGGRIEAFIKPRDIDTD